MENEEPVTIRAASADDVAAVKELIAEFVKQRILLPRSDEELASLMENGFIAEVDGRVVGCAAIDIYSRKMAEIQCLAVAEPMHGKGVGKRLVECCVQRARERNVVELMAISSSERFWMECGFDYSLPDQKRAFFIHTDPYGR